MLTKCGLEQVKALQDTVTAMQHCVKSLEDLELRLKVKLHLGIGITGTVSQLSVRYSSKRQILRILYVINIHLHKSSGSIKGFPIFR